MNRWPQNSLTRSPMLYLDCGDSFLDCSSAKSPGLWRDSHKEHALHLVGISVVPLGLSTLLNGIQLCVCNFFVSFYSQEFELQVHLVQLLGCPQPLNGENRLKRKQSEIRAKVVLSDNGAVPQVLSNHEPRNGTLVPKRRLPAGLLRLNGISPQGSQKPLVDVALRIPSLQCEVNGSTRNIIAGPASKSIPAGRAAFMPPLRRELEGQRAEPAALSHEGVWHLVTAGSIVRLTCACCGLPQCSGCLCEQQPSDGGAVTVDLFRRLFSRTGTQISIQEP